MATTFTQKLLGGIFTATVAAPLLAITAVGMKTGHDNPVEANAVTSACLQGQADMKPSTRGLLCLSVPGIKLGQVLAPAAP